MNQCSKKYASPYSLVENHCTQTSTPTPPSSILFARHWSPSFCTSKEGIVIATAAYVTDCGKSSK